MVLDAAHHDKGAPLEATELGGKQVGLCSPEKLCAASGLTKEKTSKTALPPTFSRGVEGQRFSPF